MQGALAQGHFYLFVTKYYTADWLFWCFPRALSKVSYKMSYICIMKHQELRVHIYIMVCVHYWGFDEETEKYISG